MNHTIDDLRHDLRNAKQITSTSPLYVEIVEATRLVSKKLSKRLEYDAFHSDDALNQALEHLFKPMSQTRSTTPLEHYLIHVVDRRRSIGDDMSITEFRSILYSIIRNAILRVNQTPYVSRLVSRATKILKLPPFTSTEGPPVRFSLHTHFDWSKAGDLSDETLDSLASLCADVPKIPQSSETKDSPIYSTSSLKKLLDVVLSNVSHISRPELHEIFQKLLTNCVLTPLPDSDAISHQADLAGSPDYDFLDPAIDGTILRIWSDLTENQRRLLAASTYPITADAIARTVLFQDNRDETKQRMYSRPAIVDMQNGLHAALRATLSEFDGNEQEQIVEALMTIAKGYRY